MPTAESAKFQRVHVECAHVSAIPLSPPKQLQSIGGRTSSRRFRVADSAIIPHITYVCRVFLLALCEVVCSPFRKSFSLPALASRLSRIRNVVVHSMLHSPSAKSSEAQTADRVCRRHDASMVRRLRGFSLVHCGWNLASAQEFCAGRPDFQLPRARRAIRD